MSMDVTQVVVALIGLIGVLLSTVIVPLIKAKTTAQNWNNAMFWVKMAVQSAEQIYTGTGMGQKKKEFVEDFLAKHNIQLDAGQLDVAIEAAVLEIKKAAA